MPFSLETADPLGSQQPESGSSSKFIQIQKVDSELAMISFGDLTLDSTLSTWLSLPSCSQTSLQIILWKACKNTGESMLAQDFCFFIFHADPQVDGGTMS